MPYYKKGISNKDIDGGLENKYLVNVLSLGVKNDGSVDCTEIVHQALSEGKSLFFPNGIYLLEYLELKSYNVIIGENEHETILQPKESTRKSFISICKGPCQHVRFENFKINKSPNNGQIGINIEANFPDGENSHGGLWDSIFRNIYLTLGVRNFAWNGIGMKIVGSGSNFSLPVQLNIFEKINIWSNNLENTDYIPLIVEGQVEQNLFNRCSFSGTDISLTLDNLNNSAAVFRRRRNDDGTIDGDIGGGHNTFLQCYFGNCPRCISFERSRNPRFINCYYENARQLAYISTVSTLGIDGGAFGITSTENYLIESDYTGNEIYLSNITKVANIRCRAVNMVNCRLYNTMYDEKVVVDNSIKIQNEYSVIHFNSSDSSETVNNIVPSTTLKGYNEYYFNIVRKPGKTAIFSSTGGNIYNDLNIDISSQAVLVKAKYIPYIDKYKIELV